MRCQTVFCRVRRAWLAPLFAAAALLAAPAVALGARPPVPPPTPEPPSAVGYEIAIHANTGILWMVGNVTQPEHIDPYGGPTVAPGTSPSITFLAGGGYEFAFRSSERDSICTPSAATVIYCNGEGDLFISYEGRVNGTAGSPWQAEVAPGTSPSVTALAGGAWEVAFQGTDGDLETVDSGGGAPYGGVTDTGLRMMPGTSPSIASVSPWNTYEVAYQSNTGSLETVGADGTRNWGLGMASGTSPSISGLGGGGYEVAFQDNTGQLCLSNSATGWACTNLGMAPGTSPSIAGLARGGYEAVFQAYGTGHLIYDSPAGWQDTGLGMMPGTSPSITALPTGGYEAAFQANTGALWSAGTAGVHDWNDGMASGTSPSITVGTVPIIP